MGLDFFNPRVRSLARGNALVLVSLVVSVPLSHFPHLHATALLIFPLLACLAGTADTVRCLQRRWNMYHAGVMLCLYMDLMALTMLLFLLLYPYFLWLIYTR